MPTGSFWNVDNPEKPWGPFDPQAIITFPIDVSDWLSSLASAYASHTVTASTPLEVVSSSHSSGVISARIKVATGATYAAGAKYPFTVRIVCADGQTDERTLWLKVKDR